MLKNYYCQFWGTKLAASTVSLTCLLTYPLSAQVIPDNSLGSENSIVTPDVTVKDTLADLIEGGAIRDNNLFHSFEQFNVGNGDNVYFANPDDVTNILNRVTGNNISEIFGTLGIDGAANLFLLNPNGIVFGENAVLDVSGSFLATTADSYVFENGFEYSANDSNSPPLLTINLPVGVQFGEQAEAIVNRAQSLQGQHAIFEFPITAGLQVQPEQNITLLGGDILLEGGGLTAPHGRIELGSVTPNSFVSLNPTAQNWTVDYQGVQSFQDILLSKDSVVNTSGDGGGDFQIQGRRIRIIEGSDIFSETLGQENGGKSIINASELVEVIGYSLIVFGVFDQGDGGDLTIKARELLLIDDPTIATDTFSDGDSGNIDIEVEQLLVEGGAQIGPATRDTGNSGDLTIKAKDIEIIGTNSFEDGSLISSGLFASAEPGSSGNAGNLIIETESLRIADGGKIAVNSLGTGNAGSIDIKAQNIEVSDFVRDFVGAFSGIVVSVEQGGSGSGGNLTINSDRLSVFNGGQVVASNFGTGNAGNVNIEANSIEVTGVSEDAQIPSRIAATSESNGAAGSVNLNTDSLLVQDRAEVSVSSKEGDAGNINITTNSLHLDKEGSLEAEVNAGTQGNINLTTDNIFLRNNSEINAKATGTATGGNVTIDNTDNIVLLDNSEIIADAIEGNGGNIDITTQGLFVSPDSLISASSEFGLDGKIEIKEVNGDRKFEFNQLPDKISDITNLITVTCSAADNNAFAVMGNGGIPKSPYQAQSLNTTWYDLRPVKQEKNEIASQPAPLTEATTTMIDANGELELVALTPLSTHRWVKSSCST